MKDCFILYGYSDDLVYFETENLEGEIMKFLGSHEVKITGIESLSIEYSEDGEWKIDISGIPEDIEYEYMEAGNHESEKAPDYSDFLVINTEEIIRKVQVGSRKFSMEEKVQ